MRSGDLIGERFVVQDLVGAGGMGQVYRARDTHTGDSVAIKTILALSERGHERFLREARLLAELRHPGLVRYVAHGGHDGVPFLVMEWLEGYDLSERLRRLDRDGGTGLSFDEVLSVGRRIAGALSELHQRGIVHRDVKPANVFLVEGSPHQAKLLDLGVAQSDVSRVKLTGEHELVGSPCYMAPEQAEGRLVGPPADVWALGCVLYEALTGRPPFQKNHTLALLASIVLDPPLAMSEFRPDVPEDLEDLVRQMLEKKEADRFSDASEILDALSRASLTDMCPPPPDEFVGTQTQQSRDFVGPESRPSRPSLTSFETRVACVLVAGSSESIAWDDGEESAVLKRAVRHWGCECKRAVGQDALLLTPRHGETPKEQASSLARAALSLRLEDEHMSFVLVTGRAEDGQELSLGDTVERALHLLAKTKAGSILIDGNSRAFLETRFELSERPEGHFLTAERNAEGVRTLLGRVTPWVGRQRELHLLLDTYEECADETEPRVLLVTAPAGIGKTRLRHEFIEALRRQSDEVTVLHCQGDALSAGSPFVMIGPAIRRSCGVLDGEPVQEGRQKLLRRVQNCVQEPDARRVAAFLGEMIGITFDETQHEALRAARGDAALLRESMRTAFIDWLRAESATAPVLVVLEDLHWGDLPSVQYLDAALGALSDRPFMVLALARPEVHATYPGLWQQHNMVELRLHRLSKRASATLVRDVLGAECDERTVHSIVDKADGNAFFLEELIRFAAEGRLGAVPDNVLGMVQTRLDGLDQEARRVLRAASIFGEVFWENGVRALTGDSSDADSHVSFQIGEWLTHLCDLELIRSRPTSRLPQQREYQFRHALVHDAAHEMLTETDLSLGHRLAGEWLLGAGEQDSLVLAEHFRRGDLPEVAILWFTRAAEQAFEGSDFQSVQKSCEAAIALGATGDDLGVLLSLQAQAAYWTSDYELSKVRARDALEHLEVGGRKWFRALGTTLVAAARVGETELVTELFQQGLEATCHAGAEAEQLICLSRGTFQLIFGARLREADEALLRINEIASDLSGLDALTAAQVHHVRGVRVAHRADVPAFLLHLEAAVASFEKAGDTRNVCLERTTVAWCHAELGQLEGARALCEKSTELCRAQGAGQALTYAKVNMGYILSLCPGEEQSARHHLEEAIDECQKVGNARLEGWARAHLSRVNYQTGRLVEAEEHARCAAARLAATPGLQAWARACRAQALLSLKHDHEALTLATEAAETARRLEGLLQGDALVPLVLAQCLIAHGKQKGARQVIDEAWARLSERAHAIFDPEEQMAFWQLPDCQATRALHESLSPRASSKGA